MKESSAEFACLSSLLKGRMIALVCELQAFDSTMLANDGYSPILTYNGRGVAKKGLNKNEHAIIFTGSKAPQPKGDEKPNASNPLEQGMRPPIRVKQKTHEEKLDIMSRLNYRKIYTVEHNVKVRDFGEVHKNYKERLVSNFHAAWGFHRKSSNSDAEDSDGDLEDTEEEEEKGEKEEKEDSDDGVDVDEYDGGGEAEFEVEE
jgi:hypothetical protein